MNFFKQIKLKHLIIALFILAVTLAVKTMVYRLIFEHNNRNVDLVLSFQEFNKLALTSGMDKGELLNRLIQQAGITSLAVEEDTLETLVDTGKVTMLRGSDLINKTRMGIGYPGFVGRLRERLKPDHYYLLIDDPATFERVRDFLCADLGTANVSEASAGTIVLSGDPKDLLAIGVGVSPELAKTLENYNISVIPRVKNSPRLNKELIELKFANLTHITNLNTVIFEGDSVLGFPKKIAPIKDHLEDRGLNFGYIEFTDQFGAPELANRIPQSVVRVHSISDAEMLTIPKEKAVQRYLRAARERNIRILFLHPFFTNDVNENIAYFKEIAGDLQQSGFKIDATKSTAIKILKPPSALEILIISLGVFMVFIYLFNLFCPLNRKKIIGLFILLMAWYGVCFFTTHLLCYTRLMALLCATIFPSLAIILPFRQLGKTIYPTWQAELKGLSLFLGKIVGICLLGALFLISFLAEPAYLLGIKLFLGVKLTFLLPLIILVLYFFLKPHRISSLWYILKRIANMPLKIGALLLGVAGLLIVMIYILRSGNYFAGNIPAAEEQLRFGLENLFFIRPRTKEFLIGYPLLVISFFYIRSEWGQKWTWVLTLLSAIAVISLTNSFCHAYTPLLVTLYRCFLSLILGTLIGLVMVWMIKTYAKNHK